MSESVSSETQKLVDEVQQFLRDYYADEVAYLAQHFPREQQSLMISWRDLYQKNADLADDYLDQPGAITPVLEEALANYDLPADIDLSRAHVRVGDLPEDRVHTVGGNSPSESIGKIVGYTAQVGKVADVQPRPVEAAFECVRCGIVTRVMQAGNGPAREPNECQGCERQGPFRLMQEESEWVDHQLVRVQQPPEQATGGDATEIDVELEADLVESVDPGDRIDIMGEYSIKNDPDESTGAYPTYLEGTAVQHQQTDYEDISIEQYEDEIRKIAAGEYGDPYELLTASINPRHWGDEHLKLSIGLQLFGGWERSFPGNTTERGDFHILLVGDPGAGKSTFLQYANDVAPRSTYASGKGASAAGMTAAAVRDDFGSGEWALEAGALVLADKGIACIDELDKVDEDAVASMHTALEEQKVHVNKAGFDTKLPARAALLAAGNPKYGRFDQYEPVGQQIELGPTLLSRFDLIFTVVDKPDEEKDRNIADHKIRGRQLAGKLERGDDVDEDTAEEIQPAIPKELLRAYIAYAKQEVKPTIEDDNVIQHLKDSFTTLRLANGEGDDTPVPVTFRKLEAIERIAEASARVRLSDEVTMDDVKRAMDLVGRSMRDVGMDQENEQFDADAIEVGSTMSQRQRRKKIGAIIDELAREALDSDGGSNGAPRKEIIERAEEEGIDAGTTTEEIRLMKDDGSVYELEPGYLKVTPN